MILIKRFVFERAVDFITILKRTFPDTATNCFHELFPAF